LFTFEANSFSTRPAFKNLLPYSRDPDELINKLDILLTHGQMSDDTRDIIRDAVKGFSPNPPGDLQRLKLALYLVMISPDYCVLK
jgi:hypothetical protein